MFVGLSTRAMFDDQIGTELMRESWGIHRFVQAFGKDLAPDPFGREALVPVCL